MGQATVLGRSPDCAVAAAGARRSAGLARRAGVRQDGARSPALPPAAAAKGRRSQGGGQIAAAYRGQTGPPPSASCRRPLAARRRARRLPQDLRRRVRRVTFDPEVVAQTEDQPEFVQSIWAIFAAAVSPERVDRAAPGAKARLARQGRQGLWRRCRASHGSLGAGDRFGDFSGDDSVFRALASLAFVHFQGDYFRDELLAALAILAGRRCRRRARCAAPGRARWARRSSCRRASSHYAVDFDGDGRRDIWTSAPDAIGSTANYLAKHGWIAGAPWGFEVSAAAGISR